MKNPGLFASASHNRTFQLLEKGANSIMTACAFAVAATGSRSVQPSLSINGDKEPRISGVTQEDR